MEDNLMPSGGYPMDKAELSGICNANQQPC